ncbi:MAG: hypothetical protein KF836_04470 [Fimbriimonadaceae bacterium]|nr:hypothetical protein [Fimbriimonadaceae bacterium]
MIFARRGVLIGLYTALAVPVVAVLGSAGWLYSDLYMTADRYEQVLADASTEQIPTEPAEFLRIDLPNKSNDAAPLLIELNKQWQAIDVDERAKIQNHLRAYALPSETQDSETAEIVLSAKPIIELYKRAANKSDSNIERDWASCESPFEPNYHTIIDVSRLTCSYAISQARVGTASEAFSTLDSIRKLGQHISRDSGLDGLALHSLLETMSLTASEQIMFLYGDRAEIVSQYNTFIENRKTAPNVVRNLEGEAMRSIVVLSEPDSHKNRIFAGAKLSLRGEAFQKAAAVRMTEFWMGAIGTVRAVYPDTIASNEAYLEAVQRFQEQKTPSRIVPSAIAEWNEHRIRSAAALEVRYKLAKVAGKLFVQFHKSNQLPSSLGELSISTSDPMTGDPFNYVIIEGGFQIFGRGSNGIDEDGETNGDIILRLKDGVVSNEGV